MSSSRRPRPWVRPILLEISCTFLLATFLALAPKAFAIGPPPPVSPPLAPQNPVIQEGDSLTLNDTLTFNNSTGQGGSGSASGSFLFGDGGSVPFSASFPFSSAPPPISVSASHQYLDTGVFTAGLNGTLSEFHENIQTLRTVCTPLSCLNLLETSFLDAFCSSFFAISCGPPFQQDNSFSDTQSFSATTTVTVLNVPPTADAGGPYERRGGAGFLTLNGSATDPGGSHDVLSFSWDLNGDGVFGDALGPTPRVFFGIGDHPITLQVTDKDGGVGASSTHVDVLAEPATVLSLGFSFAAMAAMWCGWRRCKESLRFQPTVLRTPLKG